MENLKLFWGRFWPQTKEFWGNLSPIKKMILTAAGLLIVGGLAALIFTREATPYEYVFVDLSPEDSQAIISYFDRNNITEYQVDNKGIKVPKENVMSLRMQLSQEGLPTHGVVGWEKFDTQEFARTEFEQKINKQRAIQGELARTIMMIEGVNNAKVHIVSPEKSLFVEDQKDPTAAVYLKTRHGQELEKKQVDGMVHLVSRSVEGLTPENVTIIDDNGEMLTEDEPDDFTSKMTSQMLEYKRSVEKKYEENIRAIVGRIVGPERVEATVDAEVDFTKETQTISNVDPDQTAVVSKQTQEQSLEGNGLNPTGIPGSKSNVPGEQEELNVSQSSTENSKNSETINYEVSKTVSEKTLPVGTIQRLSAAVIVDGKQAYPADGAQPEFQPRSEAELAKIEDLVQSAIGYSEKRGDAITVKNIMFQLDPMQIETIKEEKQEKREYFSTLAISAAIGLGLVLFFTFIVRPYFRWLAYDPEKKQEEQKIEDYQPELDLGTLQNVQVKEDVPFEKMSPQEQIHFLAKNEPRRTTEAIRLLLNPHQSSS